MPTYYISDPVHHRVLDDLRERGRVHLGFGLTPTDYMSVAAEVDAVLLRAERFDSAKISASPNLRIIARHGVGIDNVDVDAATAAGIWVTNTPGSNSRAVAEHVFALLLSLARHTPFGGYETASGRWFEAKSQMNGFELNSKTLGLMGFGSIARLVHGIARGFGMAVLVHDPFVDPSEIEATGAIAAGVETVISDSDVVSLHIPLTKETRHIIDASALEAMKSGAILINTSRGGLVDERDLVNALNAGSIAGAGLDVLEAESVDMKSPLAHLQWEIAQVPNLLVTPHVAGQSDEAFLAAGTQALSVIDQVLSGSSPDSSVNSPAALVSTHS